ncbi:MAG: septum site-determining protein MinC [Bacillota bacterium]
MVELKPQEVMFVGTREGLRLLVDAQASIDTLREAIRRRLAEAPGFYTGASVVVDTRGAVVPVQWVEEVRQVLESYGLRLSQIDHGAGGTGGADGGSTKARLRAASMLSAATAEAVANPDPPNEAAPAVPAVPGADTLLIKQSLRSGQCVSFEGNLVILGDVNPGSEVWADGDIVVFGTLRGVAHAGASGNREARVVALRLMPTQLRIADKICRAPDDDVKGPRGPEQAFLKDGAIVIEPWSTHAGTVFGG